MRRARGSMRGNVHSSDLKPGARRGGAADRQAGGAVTRVPQPQQPHHHTTSTFQRPRAPSQHSDRLQTQQECQAWVVRPIPNESGCSSALIPLNNTNIILVCFRALKTRTGLSGSNKQRSPTTSPTSRTQQLQSRSLTRIAGTWRINTQKCTQQ